MKTHINDRKLRASKHDNGQVFVCTSDFLKRQLASDKEFQCKGEGYRLSSAIGFIVIVSVIVIVNSDFMVRLQMW